jgi:hypothetical protein
VGRYDVHIGWVEVLEDRIVWHSSKRNEQAIPSNAIRSVGLEKAWTPWGKDTVVITTDET